MAIELRHRARTAERSEPIDPSQTGPRTRLPESSSIIESERPNAERPSVLPERHSSVPARRARVARPSMRPSAFGVPRTSAGPARDSSLGSGETSPREDPLNKSSKLRSRDSAPPQTLVATQPADDLPVSSQIVAKRPSHEPSRVGEPSVSARTSEGMLRPSARAAAGSLRPAVKTDIEELLPISQGVKSLPRPPRLPSFEATQQPAPAPRRFPWASLVVFAVVLAASLAPLFHYRVESHQSEPARSLRAEASAVVRSGAQPILRADAQPILRADARGGASAPLLSAVKPASEPLTVSTPTAAERVERAFWGQPKRVQQALLAEGERALLANDERLAETLFARARDFAGDEAQGAYGLARVRLAQGDLEGAQGWIGQAIKQWPRRAEYRALHAEILQRFGRGAEAQLERALARSLPRPSPDFPAETQSR